MTLLLMLLLKSLLVFAIAGLLLFALRRSSAAARHLVCLLTLCSVLLLPLCSMTLPGWQVAGMQAQGAEPTPPRSSAPLPKREGEEFQMPSPPTASESPCPPVSGGPLQSEARTQQGGGFFTQNGFLAFYLLGVLLASVRPLLGLWGIRRLSRACAAVDDAPTLAAAADCAAMLGLKCLPRLCRADVPVPMTWGGRRPVVALPLSSAAWPDARLQSVLLHEMAHVKRRDWPCHRLADFACAVLWFHPLVWLTARRLRSESEVACDDLVLASGIPAHDYARHLLEIAEALPRASNRPNAAIAMAQTPHIKRRILRPVAEAQIRLPPFLMIQGVHDVSVHHADKGWWDVDGKFLPGAVYDAEPFQLDKDLFSSTNVLNRRFVFRSSEDLLGDRAMFVPSGALVYQTSYRKAQWNVTASFPLTAKTTNITVGTASGPWSQAATLNYHRGQPVPFEIDGPSRIGLALDAANDNRIVFSVPARSIRDLHEFQAVAVSTEGYETALPKAAALRNAFTARGREEVNSVASASASTPSVYSRRVSPLRLAGVQECRVAAGEVGAMQKSAGRLACAVSACLTGGDEQHLKMLLRRDFVFNICQPIVVLVSARLLRAETDWDIPPAFF